MKASIVARPRRPGAPRGWGRNRDDRPGVVASVRADGRCAIAAIWPVVDTLKEVDRSPGGPWCETVERRAPLGLRRAKGFFPGEVNSCVSIREAQRQNPRENATDDAGCGETTRHSRWTSGGGARRAIEAPPEEGKNDLCATAEALL